MLTLVYDIAQLCSKKSRVQSLWAQHCGKAIRIVTVGIVGTALGELVAEREILAQVHSEQWLHSSATEAWRLTPMPLKKRVLSFV